MLQILLYEWKIIFSRSLIHKTPTPGCSRVCRVQCADANTGPVSRAWLESAITLQLGRGLDSPTLRIINITASPFHHSHSIGKSQIFSSPSNDKQMTKGRSQTNFLLMRNICNEAGVCVTRTMTGGRCGVLQCRTVC